VCAELAILHQYFSLYQMRTVLNLDDDAYAMAQAYARVHGLTLGRTVSELIRTSSAPKPLLRKKDGVWVFDLPPGAPPVTSAQVKDLLDQVG
jgi:hypothetical protein